MNRKSLIIHSYLKIIKLQFLYEVIIFQRNLKFHINIDLLECLLYLYLFVSLHGCIFFCTLCMGLRIFLFHARIKNECQKLTLKLNSKLQPVMLMPPEESY